MVERAELDKKSLANAEADATGIDALLSRSFQFNL